jgi:hypothetical protein
MSTTGAQPVVTKSTGAITITTTNATIIFQQGQNSENSEISVTNLTGTESVSFTQNINGNITVTINQVNDGTTTTTNTQTSNLTATQIKQITKILILLLLLLKLQKELSQQETAIIPQDTVNSINVSLYETIRPIEDILVMLGPFQPDTASAQPQSETTAPTGAGKPQPE